MISSLARWPRSPILIAGLVAVLAALAIVAVRSVGLLEAFELVAYDGYARWRSPDAAPDSRIALVTITEQDVLTYGWPVSDEVLARIIQAVARQQPVAIGLDIYRDAPRPPGTDKLDATLRAEHRVIVLMKVAQGGADGVRPPPLLSGTDRVGFSDILVDPGGVARRGLLFLDDGTHTYYSFPLRLALLYLSAHNVLPQPDPANRSYLRLGPATIPPLEPDDGGYVGADARGYQFLLDFKGARRQFAAVDLASLLAGSYEPGLFRDRIVLIGVVAESVERHFYTPFSRGLGAQQSMAGLEIHSQVASQLLRMGLDGDAPMAVLPEWQEWLWILLWSALGALVGLRVRSPWGFALAAAGCLAGLGTLDWLAFVEARWLPLVPPALAWLMAAAVVTAYMSYREAVERKQLMQLFSRHVSPEVAEAIWRQRDQFLDGGRPRPERMMVTVLFTDLTGFTAVSEKHTPEALLDWLNEYMDAMAREVSRHGGVIRQYAGDAVVAVFGVPVPRQNDAEIAQDARSAVTCALAMETALGELNRRWKAESRPTTGMRVGIFTGPVISGTLGSAQRSEYVVVGDTVNTASRLESLDKTLFAPDVDGRPIRILIGEPTLERLGGGFVTERVGEVSLKGKEHLVSIHRVIGLSREAEAAAGRAPTARRSPGDDPRAAPDPVR